MAPRDYITHISGCGDSGGVLEWYASAGAFTVEQTITRYSRGALRFNAVGEYVTFLSKPYDSDGRWIEAGVNNHYWLAFNLYLASLPSGNAYFHAVTEASINRNYWGINSTGKILVAGEGPTVEGTGTVSLQTGKWYTVSIKNVGGVVRRCIVRDANSGATVDNVVGTGTLGVASRFCQFGYWSGAAGGDWIIDNAAVVANATAGNVGDPVDFATHRFAVGDMIPNGIGSYDAWPTFVGDTTFWRVTDERPHDSDTSYASPSATTQKSSATLKALNTLVAQAAAVFATHARHLSRATAGTVRVQALLRSGATDVQTAGSTNDLATTYSSLRRLLRTTDPATSGYWTVSAVGSLQVGVIAETLTGGGALCTNVGIDVLYTVGETGRDKRTEYVMDEADDQQRIYNPNGRAIGLCEMEPNAWMRSMSETHLRLDVVDDFQDQEDMAYLEGMRYSETAEGVKKATPQGSPEDFVRTLLNRVALEAGEV